MDSAAASSEYRVQPLQRDTLQERVYRQVAGLILDGDISPGQTVTIQGLAEAFGVSAMPVREALMRLAAANALTVVSGRSMGIPPLSLERLTDLRNVRVVVEGTAMASAASNADSELIATLSEQLKRMDAAANDGATKTYIQANRLFHFSAYQASRSPTLTSLIEILWLQISPYFNLLRESTNLASANRYHHDMIEALRLGDSEVARAAVIGDIEVSYSVLSEVLSP